MLTYSRLKTSVHIWDWYCSFVAHFLMIQYNENLRATSLGEWGVEGFKPLSPSSIPAPPPPLPPPSPPTTVRPTPGFTPPPLPPPPTPPLPFCRPGWLGFLCSNWLWLDEWWLAAVDWPAAAWPWLVEWWLAAVDWPWCPGGPPVPLVFLLWRTVFFSQYFKCNWPYLGFLHYLFEVI